MKQYLSRQRFSSKKTSKISNMVVHTRLFWSSSFSKQGKVLKLTNMIFIFNFALWTFNRSRKDAFFPCSIFICISEHNKLISICGKPSGSWACSEQKIDYKLQNNEKYIFLQGLFSGKNSVFWICFLNAFWVKAA